MILILQTLHCITPFYQIASLKWPFITAHGNLQQFNFITQEPVNPFQLRSNFQISLDYMLQLVRFVIILLTKPSGAIKYHTVGRYHHLFCITMSIIARLWSCYWGTHKQLHCCISWMDHVTLPRTQFSGLYEREKGAFRINIPFSLFSQPRLVSCTWLIYIYCPSMHL